MRTSIVEILDDAIATFDEQVGRTSDWSAPSPCEGWAARDVVEHVTGTLGKVEELLAGDTYRGTPSPTGTTASDEAVVGAWRERADAVRGSLHGADLEREVDSPRGRMSLGDALALPAADLTAHSWDLAAAGGRHLDFSPRLLSHLEAVTSTIPPEMMRRPGFFGPAVEIADDASATDRYMAFLGRRRP